MHERRQLRRVRETRWELQHKTRFSEELARGDDMAASVPLTEPEIKQRLREMDRLRRATIRHRAVTYLFSCVSCQALWTAIGLLIALNGQPAI